MLASMADLDARKIVVMIRRSKNANEEQIQPFLKFKDLLQGRINLLLETLDHELFEHKLSKVHLSNISAPIMPEIFSMKIELDDALETSKITHEDYQIRLSKLIRLAERLTEEHTKRISELERKIFEWKKSISMI